MIDQKEITKKDRFNDVLFLSGIVLILADVGLVLSSSISGLTFLILAAVSVFLIWR